MELRITNGAFVHRLLSSSNEVAELLGGFQYTTDAEAFATMKLKEDAERDFRDSFYAVTCAYSGRLRIFRHPEKQGPHP